MRPPEILSMIEEAAGTRMFEDRKAKAVGTITRKDKKVAEYNSLMTDEIVPQLNKLRKEKAEYLRLQKVEAELAKIGKVLRGWEWWEGTRRVEAKGKEIEEAESRKETIQEEIEGLKERVQTAENEVTRITKAREKELKKGGRYQRLEEEVREIEKEMERLRTRVELKEKGLREEKKKREASAAELQEVSRRT
jgi:structural maintenance of chromosome 2